MGLVVDTGSTGIQWNIRKVRHLNNKGNAVKVSYAKVRKEEKEVSIYFRLEVIWKFSIFLWSLHV